MILHADPARGGAERYTVDLARDLRERGHCVTLIAWTFGSNREALETVRIPSRGLTRAGRYADFLGQLDRHLSESRYDIVHAMLPVRRCDIYHPHAGVAAQAAAASPIAIQFNRRRRLFASVERKLLTGSAAPTVLCLSEQVRRTVREYYDLPDRKLPSLFNGIDLKKFDPAADPEARRRVRARFQIPDDRIVSLMLAQDFARKGLHEAIEATARLNDRRMILLVAGRESAESYRRLAKRLGVADRVLFAGPTDDPRSFYQAADLFVLPTRHDPCSLVVLEALAMGLPVISTVHNGACEIMQSGRHGFVLADPTDITALSQAMGSLLDSALRATMSAACMELRPALSAQRHLDELLRIYAAAREA